MCGRYTLATSAADLIEHFGIREVRQCAAEMSFNVAPGQQILVIIWSEGHRVLDSLRWGLVPPWAKDIKVGYKMINARAETLAERPAYRPALLRRRCLIPADGFYEWQVADKLKQPMHISMATGKLFAFAGLWEEWRGGAPGEPPLRTCTVITTSPNTLMAPIHNRMPAILEPADEARWLSGEADVPALQAMLHPFYADLLVARPVSTLVNSPANNSPQCIEPLVSEN
jgi:putative SOS response-associated peptidase YedK